MRSLSAEKRTPLSVVSLEKKLPQQTLALLQSAERCLGVRLCYHDYLGYFRLPYAYTVHESVSCLRKKQRQGKVCHGFCGADGEVDRQILQHPHGWLHECPLGETKISVAVACEGVLAGVLFAELSAREDEPGSARKGGAVRSTEGNRQLADDAVQRTLQEQTDIQRLLCGVARQLEALLRGGEQSAGDGRRGVILRYIEETIHAPADLGGLGRALNLSSSRSGHLVREIFGRSFRDLALEARVNRAALLLGATELDLSEIALRLGFTDQSHFTRVFRQRYALTPAAYRRTLRTRRH